MIPNAFNSDEDNWPIPEITSILACDKAWFVGREVMAFITNPPLDSILIYGFTPVLLTANSGSIRFKVNSIDINNGKMNISFKKEVPEIGTCDMAGWHIIVETEKVSIDKINELFEYQETSNHESSESYYLNEFIYNQTLYTLLNIDKISSDKRIIITDM